MCLSELSLLTSKHGLLLVFGDRQSIIRDLIFLAPSHVLFLLGRGLEECLLVMVGLGIQMMLCRYSHHSHQPTPLN